MLVEHIGELVTNDPARDGALGILRDAAVAIDGERIAWVGARGAVPEGVDGPRVDAGGGAALPGFVDSHTHLVFAGDRTAEFDARMRGERYAAGGIRTTVAATRAASDDELRVNARRLRDEALRTGTTHIEIKSGYGLDVDDEARLLSLAGELTDDVTFLGGHVVAPEYAGKPDEYVDLVRGEMLDACAPLAVLTSAFNSGQSAIASEPSAIDSVSRYGDATLPASRWSRPITIGAWSSPRATMSLNRMPRRWRSP